MQYSTLTKTNTKDCMYSYIVCLTESACSVHVSFLTQLLADQLS